MSRSSRYKQFKDTCIACGTTFDSWTLGRGYCSTECETAFYDAKEEDQCEHGRIKPVCIYCSGAN